MALHPTTRAILSACIFTATSLAQTAPPQNPPATAPCPSTQPSNQATKPCTPQTPKKSAAEQFPFPGETYPPPASPPDSPAPASTPPDSPSPKTSPADAASQHPFPTTTPPKLPDADSSSSSSSSGDDPDASPTMPPDDAVPTPTTRHRLPKVAKVQSDDERVDEDISVSKFYMDRENYQGAYLRAQDAVKTQPDYSLTHFTLAQVLQKMKRNDEAVAEYQVYLKLDPDGEKAKAAKQAVADLKNSK